MGERDSIIVKNMVERILVQPLLKLFPAQGRHDLLSVACPQAIDHVLQTQYRKRQESDAGAAGLQLGNELLATVMIGAATPAMGHNQTTPRYFHHPSAGAQPGPPCLQSARDMARHR